MINTNKQQDITQQLLSIIDKIVNGKQISNYIDKDDIKQELAIKGLNISKRYDSKKGEFENFMSKALKNEFYSIIKKMKNESNHYIPMEDDFDTNILIDNDSQLDFNDFCNQHKYGKIANKIYNQGLTPQELSNELGVSDKRIYQCLNEFKRDFKKWYE